MDKLTLTLQGESTMDVNLRSSDTLSLQSDVTIGTGTRDYNRLLNKPSINGVTLYGNQTLSDLYIVSENTKAGWAEMTDYIPKKGEIVVYTDQSIITDDKENEIAMPEIKIGDGNSYAVDLPFVGDAARYETLRALQNHVADTTVHITQAEREFWNAKLNYQLSNETLVLTRY